MKVKKVYRVHAYNEHINKQLVEWYTTLKEAKLRTNKLLANGFVVIDDYAIQEQHPIVLSFVFTPDEIDKSYFKAAASGNSKDVKLLSLPAFGCPSKKGGEECI